MRVDGNDATCFSLAERMATRGRSIPITARATSTALQTRSVMRSQIAHRGHARVGQQHRPPAGDRRRIEDGRQAHGPPDGQRQDMAIHHGRGNVALEHDIHAPGLQHLDRGRSDLLVAVGRDHVVRGHVDPGLFHGGGHAVLLAHQNNAVHEPVVPGRLDQPQILDAMAARQDRRGGAQSPGDFQQIGDPRQPFRRKLAVAHWLFSSFSRSSVHALSTCSWCQARIPSLSPAARCLKRAWTLNQSATGTTVLGL